MNRRVAIFHRVLIRRKEEKTMEGIKEIIASLDDTKIVSEGTVTISIAEYRQMIETIEALKAAALLADNKNLELWSKFFKLQEECAILKGQLEKGDEQ